MKATVNCFIKVDAKDPNKLKCSSKCRPGSKSMWVEGVVYQRVLKLEKMDKMAKVTFNKNKIVSCEVINTKTDAELQKHSYKGGCEKEATTTKAPEVVTEAPKKETTEAPKAKTTKAPKKETTEAPKEETTEAPKEETTEAPKEETTEAPKAKTTKAPKKETTEAPKEETTEAPKAETTEAPKAETTEAPKAETTEAPKEETTEAPKTEAPEKETTSPPIHKGKTLPPLTTISQTSTDGIIACDTQTATPEETTTLEAESTTMFRQMVCPVGWKQLGDACFYMSNEEEIGTRDDGRAYCDKIGGKLASIRSKKENNFVKNTFTFDNTWIGLGDEGVEGAYQWEDFSNSTYRNWDDGEPNNSGYVWGEDCVEMEKSGFWNDEGCNEVGRRYLCRRDAELYPRTECSAGWTKHPTTGICYFVSSYMTTYDDAVEKCKLLGFHAAILVPISEEENNFISELTQEDVWLGLHDKAGEGEFTDENGAAAIYFNWDDGEPNDLVVEDCVQRLGTGKWNDLYCGTPLKFACYM
ncbi:uncharacterized protein LOC143033024 isoform X2 [Oratosquilla oratoria]